VVLDSSQAGCFEEYRAGRNVGIFACAGSGKSVLLRAIIRDAVSSWGAGSVAVCSWYGAAADLIGGTTLNSFFGVGVFLATPDQFLAAAKARSRLATKLRQVRVLVIDEVFTITSRWLVVYLKLLRGLAPAGAQQHPAGGVQVIGMLVIACPSRLRWKPPVQFGCVRVPLHHFVLFLTSVSLILLLPLSCACSDCPFKLLEIPCRRFP